MMKSSLPRIVVVTRLSPFTQLHRKYGTQEQAAFYVKTRGQSITAYQEGHNRVEAGLATVLALLPVARRRARVDRDELDRFVFEPEDLVIVVGQDGLVANVAKYLNDQFVLGINPDPARYDGILCTIPPGSTQDAITWAEAPDRPNLPRNLKGAFGEQRRVMAIVEREDGQKLRSLNEVFIGHRTHQSSRYVIKANVEGVAKEERHSSSGIICTTGTGATGWGRSVASQRGVTAILPTPEEPKLAFFVREPFPSVATGTSIDHGVVGPNEALTVISEMGEDGVIFADGIENDRIEFTSGQVCTVRIDAGRLRLIVKVKEAEPEEEGPWRR